MNKTVKILAIMGDNSSSGSKYHRLYLPLKKLNGMEVDIEGEKKTIEVDFVDNFNPPMEILEKYDIIWNNFACNIPNSTIGLLQSKGKKFVEDIDDYWELPKKNVMVPIVGRVYENVPVLSAIADVTVCSNENLAHSLIQFSNNLSISYNDLPIEEDQFIVRDNIKVGNKVAIGICGSISHLMDYESIAIAVEKICKDKELKKECKFVIAGYDSRDSKWEKVINIFSKHKFEVELRNSKPVGEYMSLYEGINILLAPLSDVEFNRKKSGLKLLEASVHNIPVLASPMYANKEFNNCIICKTNNSWLKSLKYLIRDDNYIELGKQLSETNRNLSNFDGRIENLRLLVQALMSQEMVPSIPNLDLYSIKYKEEQDTEYTPYLNINLETPWRFEYQTMLEIIPKVEKEYVGVLSWKFLQKTGLPKNLLYNILRPVLKNKEVDVVNLSPQVWRNGFEYMKFSEDQHPGLENILKMICSQLGVNYKSNPSTIIYSNFFIMKTELYKEYVETWIKPSLYYMENVIWDEVNKDANYLGGLSKEQLKENTNLDFYNYITFVLERLILQFIDYKQLKVKNV